MESPLLTPPTFSFISETIEIKTTTCCFQHSFKFSLQKIKFYFFQLIELIRLVSCMVNSVGNIFYILIYFILFFAAMTEGEESKDEIVLLGKATMANFDEEALENA